ncbi:helix-turn-helix domain-containing protein [Desulfopila sp. IMCC35006]|uniref:helix-turn-helix domain-containing protein n=1 Tax=Desulfopila sp. IMCC35006 TaxID=2569542 RepID=UPI00142EA890|nr:helix-turn-helix transcriptional regulator [Desulfopila sp. IMCC35006]
MKWAGEKVRDLAKAQGFSIASLAESIGVSRKAVNDWTRGQIPKGNHLMALARLLNINPEELFNIGEKFDISIPVHRTRGNAKVTEDRSQEAFNLAKDYYSFFLNDSALPVVPVIRETDKSDENARNIARILRKMTSVQNGEPLKKKHVFSLLKDLGIKIVIKKFPESLKVYAFYTRILAHRVVFVNRDTNFLDLNFALLHEAVHAVRDETFKGRLYDKKEEDFCDLVANYVQFPDEYVQFVANNISDLRVGQAINILKSFAEKNGHALHGIVKRIYNQFPSKEPINPHGADTNLKKEFYSIGDYLMAFENAEEYVTYLKEISPLFLESLVKQVENLTYRRLGELLDIESSLDAADLKDEFLKLRKEM